MPQNMADDLLCYVCVAVSLTNEILHVLQRCAAFEPKSKSEKRFAQHSARDECLTRGA